MMEVLVSTVGLTFLACFRTLRDWSIFALGSRTNLQTDGTDGHLYRNILFKKKANIQPYAGNIYSDYHKQLNTYTVCLPCVHASAVHLVFVLTEMALMCPLLVSVCITVPLPMTAFQQFN